MAKRKLKERFAAVHKLAAGIWLLAFFVIVITGFESGARVSTMLMKAVIVTVAISVVSRIVVSIFATSEEMNGG